MNDVAFDLAGAALVARSAGTLHWPAERLLCVSDLHLGKADRAARRLGALLPPYEGADTLARLEAEIAATAPATVVCLGDSFDDRAAAEALPERERLWLARLAAGVEWVWIEGNHDPGPLDLPGSHRAELARGPLLFRHIARAEARGEVSGHYHPKLRLPLRGTSVRRPCFLVDARRVVMPAFGTYTGGMDCAAPPLDGLMGPEARAILTGPTAVAVPLARLRRPA